MNKSQHVKSLLLATTLMLGGGIAVQADDSLPGDPVAPVTGNQGLLGEVYGTLTYSYVNLDDSSTHADNYSFAVNQPLSFGLDGILSYDFSQSGEIAGSRIKTHTLGAMVRAFSTAYNWGKPYVEAGGGFAWSRYAGGKDNSFVWRVGIGSEFQLSPATIATPYVHYVDAPDFGGDGVFKFGVKASHWVNSQWTLTAGIELDDEENTAFTIGTNFRY